MAILPALVEAKAAVKALGNMPFQRSWAQALQAIELKREVAGTSRIEGAEFTERELDDALEGRAPEALMTRSQKQARAAINTYRWIATLPHDRPLDAGLVKEVHRRIVTGCDDDHCPPGVLRGRDENVTFGRPRHRGVEGGPECQAAFDALWAAVNGELRGHDPLVQAFLVHYHIGAMHPFLDGNGRTARALEALLLNRAELKDTLFVAMSNYYYEEKDAYLAALNEAGSRGHVVTGFLNFALTGLAKQCQRLLVEIRGHIEKSLYREVMGKMYGRLMSTRKRALATRQLEILSDLLERPSPIPVDELYRVLDRQYRPLKAPRQAYARDLAYLIDLEAIDFDDRDGRAAVSVRLKWATEVTETEFFRRMDSLPKAKTTLIQST